MLRAGGGRGYGSTCVRVARAQCSLELIEHEGWHEAEGHQRITRLAAKSARWGHFHAISHASNTFIPCGYRDHSIRGAIHLDARSAQAYHRVPQGALAASRVGVVWVGSRSP